MPTLFILLGFRFFFYSNDHVPVHVHVAKGDSEAKYNLFPDIVQVECHGFKKNEVKLIESIIEENRDIIIERWEAHFKQKV